MTTKRRPATSSKKLRKARSKPKISPKAAQLGRAADAPWNIPPIGWKLIFARSYKEFSDDRILAVSAGVTFYALLAIFPAITALVSLYGLAADRTTLSQHLAILSNVVPQGGLEIVSDQLTRLASQPDTSLGIGFLLGLGAAVWSANAGVKAMFDALNVAYDETEKRGFVHLNLVSLAFTGGAILFLLMGLTAIAVIPIALGYLGLPSFSDTLISGARWPLMFAIALFCVSILYRFGPSRSYAKWRWITPGGAVASALWIVTSLGFSWYATNFGSYNETYGTLGAVIGFMTWIWLSAAVVLLGAELNAESERQTMVDSTTGSPRPLGKRGAAVADAVA